MSFYCDICGRESKRKIKLNGHTLCKKHFRQFKKYGKFLDHNPRTRNDPNEYKIYVDAVFFDLYCERTLSKVAEFIIDLEDIEKVKYHKWVIRYGRIVTGFAKKGTERELSWVILGLDNKDEKNKNVTVKYINGDMFDNRKQNLRICVP